jgi:hypothetical protein
VSPSARSQPATAPRCFRQSATLRGTSADMRRRSGTWTRASRSSATWTSRRPRRCSRLTSRMCYLNLGNPREALAVLDEGAT